MYVLATNVADCRLGGARVPTSTQRLRRCAAVVGGVDQVGAHRLPQPGRERMLVYTHLLTVVRYRP